MLLRQSIQKENQKIALPLRLQAYERLALLLERMHPKQLTGRNPVSGISAQSYKDKLIAELNSEYLFNVTQQIYVSSDIWKVINQVRQQMQLLLIEIYSTLPEHSNDTDFVKAVNQYLQSAEEDKIPTNVGLKYLKNEVAQIF